MMKKKLLIYAHYYYPDVAATGQILQELAERLKERFDITVVCSVPSYTGEIPPHYRQKKVYLEEYEGVKLVRVPVPPFSKSDKFSRIKNLLSYYFGAKKATRTLGRQDYVFTISQPPVLGGLLGVYAKKKCKAKLIYNIQDFNPEQIEAVGYFTCKPFLWLMKKIDTATCQKSDTVVVVGRDMVQTLKNRFHGRPMPKYCTINNWTDERAIFPLSAQDKGVQAFKARYGLEGKFIIMYSGNLGLYYDLPNLLKVVASFKDRKDVAFVFVGQGGVESELKAYKAAQGLDNVVFLPYQPKESLLYSLNAADVHWVVNAKGIKGVSVPSKLYGVMAAGKPVLGVLEAGSEAREIIQEAGCGLIADPADYKEIERLLHQFINKQADIAGMGASGRAYLEAHLTKTASVEKYIRAIEEC
ncbi:MAG: glycosyltransferase family 4 protein [Clostridia bacterium]|nr:glycosyltransferase family 4 protein [Clostridia bacterium]